MHNIPTRQILEEFVMNTTYPSLEEHKAELEILLNENNDDVNQIVKNNSPNKALEALCEELIKSIPTIDDECGFSSLVFSLAEMQKPMIAHNGSIDNLHLYDKFINDLPSTLAGYKEAFHESFPLYYDTKYFLRTWITLSEHFDKPAYTSLGEAYKIVTEKKQFDFNDKIILSDDILSRVPSHETPYSLDGEASHEAGFDAMMTGILFYKLVTSLSTSKEFNPSEFFNDSYSPINNMYRNRIPLARRTPINLNLKDTKQDGIPDMR